MGLITKVVNLFQKKQIKKFIKQLRSQTNENKAEKLILLFLSRNMKLFPNPIHQEKLRSMGIDENNLKHATIRIYHYQKGNEVPIMKFQDAYENMHKDKGKLAKLAWSSLNIHFFTNLALSYDGYTEIVREMWDVLFEGAGEVESMFKYLMPTVSDLNDCCSLFLINIDELKISREEFLQDPRVITPHFFQKNSKIAKELEERKTLQKKLGI